MTSGASPFAEEQDEGSSFFSQIPAILKQRRWYIAIPAVVCAILSVIAAFGLPTEFQSKSTILVEDSLLPDDMTASDPGIVDQRMARIRQQVLSRPQLIELIRLNDLYAAELRRTSMSEVIETMRNATAIEPVNAEIQRSGSNKRGSIAFTLHFNYEDPVKAQAVAQAMTEEILKLDASKNAAQAGNVVDFLKDQAAGLQKQIIALEDQISQIKSANGLALSPGSMFGMGGSTGSYDAQIAALQRDNRTIQMQRDAMRSGGADRDPGVSAAEAQLAAARSIYSENHPDVVFAKQRLEEARKLASTKIDKLPLNELDQQIQFNNAQIAALQAARSQVLPWRRSLADRWCRNRFLSCKNASTC